MNLLTIVILKVNLLFLKDLADLDLTIVKIVLSYTSCQIDQSHRTKKQGIIMPRWSHFCVHLAFYAVVCPLFLLLP